MWWVVLVLIVMLIVFGLLFYVLSLNEGVVEVLYGNEVWLEVLVLLSFFLSGVGNVFMGFVRIFFSIVW